MPAKSKDWTALVKLLPLIFLLCLAAYGFFAFREHLTFSSLRENREALLAFRDQDYLLTVLAFIGIYVAVVALSLPWALIVTLTGGFLFGTLWGSLFNVIGATIGATAIFAAVRFGFGQSLQARMDASDGTLRRIKEGLDNNQWSMLFFLRLVPTVPFFVANLIPALLAVPVYRFAISTFFGIMPGSLVYTSVGAGLGEVFSRGETPNFGIVKEPHILFPMIGLCLLSLLPVAIKAFSGKKEPNE